MGEDSLSSDWLPACWKVEARVRRNGKKDKYYIDPVTGHLFHSMKEVFCHLDTGKMVKRSSKPKDQEPIESPAETGKEKPSYNKVQKLDIENPNQETGEEAPATDHLNQSQFDNLEQRENKEKSAAAEEAPAADPINQSQFDNLEQKENKEKSAAAEEVPAADRINQSQFDNLEQRENKEKSSESESPVVEDLQEKLQQDGNGVERQGTECKKRKKNKKGGAELPRRTSKRLAGIAIELPVELKMRNRVHQAAATHMSEGEAKCADNHQDSKSSDENVEKVRTENDAEKKQEDLDVSFPGDAGIQEEHAKQEVVECNGDEKQETLLDSSLKGLWKDPCIEFAIKTLTGAIPIVDEEKVVKDPVVSVDLPLGAVPGNQDLPLGDIWADPCIEFAVKTLTGDMPVINNRDVQNIFQQPYYSNFGGEKGLLLPNFWSTKRSPAGVSFTHSEQPFKQL